MLKSAAGGDYPIEGADWGYGVPVFDQLLNSESNSLVTNIELNDMESFMDPRMIVDWHVHVYFDDQSENLATSLYEQMVQLFSVEIGRLHRDPVGPHTKSQYRVLLPPSKFSQLIPWLALNRGGLSVLIHPNTDNELADHLDYPMWMGTQVPLKLDALPM